MSLVLLLFNREESLSEFAATICANRKYSPFPAGDFLKLEARSKLVVNFSAGPNPEKAPKLQTRASLFICIREWQDLAIRAAPRATA
jgi:hypothetical protein